MTLREEIINILIKRNIKAIQTEEELLDLFKTWALEIVGKDGPPRWVQTNATKWMAGDKTGAFDANDKNIWKKEIRQRIEESVK